VHGDIRTIHQMTEEVLVLADDHDFVAHSPLLHAKGPAYRGPVNRPGTTLNARRAAEGMPVTEVYLGLHIGTVFYGNVGSRERLDFTVVGPAV
jgi:hypothetical protein